LDNFVYCISRELSVYFTIKNLLAIFNKQTFVTVKEYRIYDILKELADQDDLIIIKSKIRRIFEILRGLVPDENGFLEIDKNGNSFKINAEYLRSKIDQISETKSLERTQYYIQRLIKALSEEKTSKLNDINLHR